VISLIGQAVIVRVLSPAAEVDIGPTLKNEFFYGETLTPFGEIFKMVL
jgi:hypothetical protein